MGLLQASAESVSFDGHILDEDIEEFERALDVLRRNPQVRSPVIDLSQLKYMPSRAIGALVTLWVDLAEEGRWFEVRASDDVWRLLEDVGVASVFLKRPR